MYVLLGCAVSLCAVFGASLASKTGRGSFRAFATSAGPLRLFPTHWRAWLAATVVAAEVAVLAGLIAGLFSPWWTALTTVALLAFAGAALLLTTFTVAIMMSLRRGDRAPCRCFGDSQEPLGHGHAVRNLLLLTVAAVGAGTAVLAEPTVVQPAGVVVAVVAGLVAGLLAVRFDDVADLIGGSPDLPIGSGVPRTPHPVRDARSI